MSTTPASPAVPAAAESAAVAVPKKPPAKPVVSPEQAKAVARKPAAKVPVKPTAKVEAVKTAAKPLAKAFAPNEPATKPVKAQEKAGKAEKSAKPAKVKKPKLVRERFTATEDDIAVLGALKQRARKLAIPVKKAVVLRAGIRALTALSDTALVALLKQIAPVK